MVLNAENRQAFVPQPFERLVIQIDVAGLDVGRKPGRVDGEAMVLSRDLDLAGRLVSNRVVGAAMAELELERLGTERLAEQLMAQADPEDRGFRAGRRRSGSACAAWRWPRSEGEDRPVRSR